MTWADQWLSVVPDVPNSSADNTVEIGELACYSRSGAEVTLWYDAEKCDARTKSLLTWIADKKKLILYTYGSGST
jgi:hypothetical protein